MKTKQHSQLGFTIVELMIATMVFSTVLVLLTSGVIYFTNVYYKGVTLSTTQNTARQVTDSISQAIQFSGSGTYVGAGVPSGDVKVLCVGAKRYTYILDRKVTDGTPTANEVRHALVGDRVGACSGTTGAVPNFGDAQVSATSAQELVARNMRLSKLEVVQLATPGLYQVTVGVVYGDNDLLSSDHTSCEDVAGSQYCGAAMLVTTVQKRLN